MTETPPQHWTAWQDDARAGVYCDGHDTDLVLDAHEDKEPRPCPRCGALLRLYWDVHIKEVKPT